jgi:hypothetical protein
VPVRRISLRERQATFASPAVHIMDEPLRDAMEMFRAKIGALHNRKKPQSNYNRAGRAWIGVTSRRSISREGMQVGVARPDPLLVT